MEEKRQGPFQTSIDSNSGTNAKGEADPRNDGWSKIFPPRMSANWGDTHASGSPDPIGRKLRTVTIQSAGGSHICQLDIPRRPFDFTALANLDAATCFRPVC